MSVFSSNSWALADPVAGLALADRFMVPWTEWAYCTCGDPTGSPAEGIVNDPRKPKTGSNLVTTTLDTSDGKYDLTAPLAVQTEE